VFKVLRRSEDRARSRAEAAEGRDSLADTARQQKCPELPSARTTSHLVSGQKLRCSCGLSFVVRRTTCARLSSGLRVTVRGTESGGAPLPDRRACHPRAQGGAGGGREPPRRRLGSCLLRAAREPPPVAAPRPGAEPPHPPRPGGGARLDKPTRASTAATAVASAPVPGTSCWSSWARAAWAIVWAGPGSSRWGAPWRSRLLAPELACDPSSCSASRRRRGARGALAQKHVQIIDRGGTGDAHFSSHGAVRGPEPARAQHPGEAAAGGAAGLVAQSDGQWPTRTAAASSTATSSPRTSGRDRAHRQGRGLGLAGMRRQDANLR
jgi:hypothetical protein